MDGRDEGQFPMAGNLADGIEFEFRSRNGWQGRYDGERHTALVRAKAWLDLFGSGAGESAVAAPALPAHSKTLREFGNAFGAADTPAGRGPRWRGFDLTLSA
jgi:hypothetical protein